jgi:glutamyl-tRNA reductase
VNILCVGLSHHTAPVELRERLAYSPSALQAALARFSCGIEARPAGLTELVILSTCNRLELYSTSRDSSLSNGSNSRTPPAVAETLLNFVAETRGSPVSDFAPYAYTHLGQAAVEHLCRVSSGLDSLVLGEPQVLGQVAEAYEAALGHGACGSTLSALFRTALRAGKRARTETAISRNAASVSSVAVKLAEAVVGQLDSAHVLVLGAGDTAELAVEALRVRGARQITVVNRTLERAQQLAGRWGGEALTFERLEEALAEADIVITSTGAPHIVIQAAMVEGVIARRPERPLVFVDIAVPRDVDPQVSGLPNVQYYDIDDLHAHLNGAVAERQKEVPRVEAIVADESAHFAAWLQNLEIAPVIADLRAKAEAIRRSEVEKTLRHLPALGEAERGRIEALTEALVSKLLHDPTMQLKAEASNGHAPEYAAAVRHLFALDFGESGTADAHG